MLGLTNDDSKRCKVSWVYQTVDGCNRLRFHHSRFVFMFHCAMLNMSNTNTKTTLVGFFRGTTWFLFPNYQRACVRFWTRRDRLTMMQCCLCPRRTAVWKLMQLRIHWLVQEKTRFSLIGCALIGKMLTSIGGDYPNLNLKQLKNTINRKQLQLVNENNLRNQVRHLPNDTNQKL